MEELKKEIRSLSVPLGVLQTNCYIVWREESSSCVLIDPGDRADRLITVLDDCKLAPSAILLTHAHYDHIMAVEGILQRWPKLPLFISEAERPMVEDPSLNCGLFHSDCRITPSHYVKEGDVIDVAGMSFLVLQTPGHTAGSACFLLEEADLLFSGDTMFRGSYGRYDLPTGSFDALAESLQRLLTTLPPDTRVLPGHGPATEIGTEQRNYSFTEELS